MLKLSGLPISLDVTFRPSAGITVKLILMKNVRMVVLIVGVLVAGLAFSSMANAATPSEYSSSVSSHGDKHKHKADKHRHKAHKVTHDKNKDKSDKGKGLKKLSK